MINRRGTRVWFSLVRAEAGTRGEFRAAGGQGD